ncbi:MAG: hypothetical protein ABH851_03720 [Methanobacteriota archaeon]
MDYVKLVIFLGVLLMLFGVSKMGLDYFVNATSTTSTSTTTTSTTTTSSTTTSTTTTTTSTSTTSFRVIYSTTLWGDCYDGLRNQNELGIDCGGECKPCEVRCTEDSDCGKPHEDETVCINNSIYRPYIAYTCTSPWMVNASCNLNKRFIFVDRCNSQEICVKTNFCPGDHCVEARCLIWPYEACKWIKC